MTAATFNDEIEVTLATLAAGSVRWPVLNHEPRQPISPVKRALIHQRDGGRCIYCGSHEYGLVLDHIIPRSAFLPAEVIRIGDRSDNLQGACWADNDARSNFRRADRKRPGVTLACWDCTNDTFEPDEIPWLESPVLAYCGKHGGISYVPDVSWLL